MRRRIFVLLFAFVPCIFLTLSSFAQSLPPVGAVWTYFTEGVNPYKGTQLISTAEKDTVIQQRVCRVIRQSQYLKNKTEKEVNRYYFCDSSGYVSVLIDSVFVPYFNFNVLAGDTTPVMIRYGKQHPEQMEVVVDSVYVKDGLRHFWLNPVPSRSRGLKTLFAERFFKPYFHEYLSVVNVVSVMEGGTSLNCYNDSQINYRGASGKPCIDTFFYQVGSHNSQYTISKYREAGNDSTPYYTMRCTMDNNQVSTFTYSDEREQHISAGDLKIKQDETQKVWVWYNNNWVLLYDFMAKAGDTITTTAVINPLHITNGATGYEGVTTFQYIIDSVSQYEDQLVQFVSNIPGSGWEMPGLIFEGIGSTIALLGQPVINNRQGNPGYVRCFMNNNFFKGIQYFNFSEVSGCNTLWNSLRETELLNNISVYPNPVPGSSFTVQLKSAATNVNMEIMDLFGRTVSAHQLNLSETDISTSQLNSGVYLLKLTTNEGQRTIKLLVQ